MYPSHLHVLRNFVHVYDSRLYAVSVLSTQLELASQLCPLHLSCTASVIALLHVAVRFLAEYSALLFCPSRCTRFLPHVGALFCIAHSF